jgi:septal ring factor EnvC (AmiA/AmiB activator)
MRKFILAGVAGLMLAPLCYSQETITPPPVANTKHAAGDLEQMRTSIKQLTAENERLRNKIADLERRLKNHSIRDRMTQEEQRAENLDEQLFSITKEEANLQGQLDEVNEQLRPENIQQLPVMGSLRPEEVRESTRRKLSNQQSRIQAQLQLLQQSRSRIQSSISVTDMLIQNLRSQLQAAAHP